jgi:hypothetical protein
VLDVALELYGFAAGHVKMGINVERDQR